MADVKFLLLFCIVLGPFCSLSAALDDDFQGPSPVDPEAADQWEAVGQVWEEQPHDHSFDEEALFSPEGKRKLYSLPPEEAKKELRKLIERIDTDGNRELSREEMIAQLERVDQGYFRQDLEQRWPQVDLDGDGYVTHKEYLHSMGQEDDMEEDIEDERRNDRFKQADSDGDDRLSKVEFDALLHPDLHEYMVQHLVEDHLNQHDTDHDGVISFDEYMALYAQATEGDQVPDWVVQEQKEFKEVFDKNGDGKYVH